MYAKRLVAFDRLLVSIETTDPEEPLVVLIADCDYLGNDTELFSDSERGERGVQESDLRGQQARRATEEDMVKGHCGDG